MRKNRRLYLLVDPRTAIKEKKSNWIGHLLHRKCLLKHIIEGKIEGTEEEKENINRFCKFLGK
jgi:hypothetical protein